VKTDENVEKVGTLVWNECHLSITMVAEIKYGKGNSKTIMSKNLNMRNLCTKVMLKNWNEGKRKKFTFSEKSNQMQTF
jgi:hypothetical protein